MKSKSILFVPAFLICFLGACGIFETKAPVSRFGQYRGYNDIYDNDVVKRSDYIVLSDGTRLAFDLFLPSENNRPVDRGWPVLFCYTTYLRALNMVPGGEVVESDIFPMNWMARLFIAARAGLVNQGNIFDMLFREPWLRKMVAKGYAVIVVEARGTGASSGIIKPIFKRVADDISEVLDWIAAQPWCNGRVGMFGKSMTAMNQYAAASTAHPCLKAIFPVSAGFDMYDAVVYPGGIYNKAFGNLLSAATATLEKMIVPVDTDPDGKSLEAILNHRRKRFTLDRAADEGFKQAPFRDSESAHPEGDKLWEDIGSYTLLQKVNQAGIAVYNATGWLDIFCRDSILWHVNLTVPRKLYIGSLSHSELGKKKKELDHGVEAERWFDFWLKKIPNGIMKEAPIHYVIPDKDQNGIWYSSDTWPLPQIKSTTYYLHQAGLLSSEKPIVTKKPDRHPIDYSATTGNRSRWNAILIDCHYQDMAANEKKGRVYTTVPLETELYMAGHAIISLEVETEAADLDLFAYLAVVDGEGRSRYLTEGCLRASFRLISEAPFNNLGLPFQRGDRHDMEPIKPGEPMKLVFDLLPFAGKIDKGDRLRVAIACADKDNFFTPLLTPAPEVKILTGSETDSYLKLPVVNGFPK